MELLSEEWRKLKSEEGWRVWKQVYGNMINELAKPATVFLYVIAGFLFYRCCEVRNNQSEFGLTVQS